MADQKKKYINIISSNIRPQELLPQLHRDERILKRQNQNNFVLLSRSVHVWMVAPLEN